MADMLFLRFCSAARCNAPLRALQVWAESHVEDVLDAQDRYDAAADARTLAP
ncbi:hypothetical protein [Streptomyces sp. CS090A]|uniref:hypothetical protein n=1 Tax=Streptomyces sp. CS090A TaxID=2162710 RepID=UPI001EF66362|nr:hypothetical protein [Streptomyces sp. CS090A]